MKEQVQKKRTLGLDEVFFLPAWAALLALGSCGSTPEAAPGSAPEFQLAAPEVVVAEPAPTQSEVDAQGATAVDHTMGKPAAVANVALGDDAAAMPEPEVEVAADVPVEAPGQVQPVVALTPEQQLAAVTLSAPPTYKPEPVVVAEAEPKSNVQRDLQSLLLSPAWQQRGANAVAEVAEEQPLASELEVAAETALVAGDGDPEAMAEALAAAAAEVVAAEVAAAEVAAAEVAAAEVAAAEVAAAEVAAAEVAAAEVAAAEVAAAEVAAAEVAAAEVAAAEVAAAEVAAAGVAAAAEAETRINAVQAVQADAGTQGAEGQAVPNQVEQVLEKPSGIVAQVAGETFGSDVTPVVAAQEQQADEGPITEFNVTWPESLEAAEPSHIVAKDAVQEQSFSDFEPRHALSSNGELSPGSAEVAIEPDLGSAAPESMDSELLADAASETEFAEGGAIDTESGMLAEGEAFDIEFQELEQVPVGLSDIVANMMQPSFEPMLEPALAPIARSMAFLKDVPIATRAMAGPLFALDPSGLFGNLALGAALIEEGAGEVYAQAGPVAKDPNLPAGERLAAAGPVLSDEETKKLAEEPGLGWLWWDESVPSHHVSSEVDIQTPSVGRVRIVLESGDYVEGILHAVGKGLYWIDGDLGRFSVKYTLVSHVERLPKPGLGAEIEGLQAGDLVRVKMASGYVEGRMISAKGDSLLIETSDGIRMTLESTDVQRLGDSKTRVIVP